MQVSPDGLDLYWRVREQDENDAVSVTLALLNVRKLPKGELRDVHCFFQVCIRVTAPEATDCPFAERVSSAPSSKDEDLAAYRLLYSTARSYAVGHGCSVEWLVDCEPAQAFLATTAAPKFDLHLSDSNPLISDIPMASLGRDSKEDVQDRLRTLCDGYGRWIGERFQTLPDDLSEDQRSTAAAHLSQCTDALARMRDGIDCLDDDGDDDDVWLAFQLMNVAMAEQRARAQLVRRGGAGSLDIDGQAWRPFQLAFILLCLRGICDAESADRDLTDLLWFPTGGGKTEAYLGLIALTAFLRRLRAHHKGESGAGTTAFMRYTLRLLTAQQFERASILICACETIRRRRSDLGDVPISIGLWVGRDGTPNTLKEARESSEQASQTTTAGEGQSDSTAGLPELRKAPHSSPTTTLPSRIRGWWCAARIRNVSSSASFPCGLLTKISIAFGQRCS